MFWNMRELRQKLLEFVDEKNPGLLSKLKGDEQEMASRLLDILKPEIEQRDRNNLYDYVQEGGMTVDFAAKKSGVSVSQFRQQMEEYVRSRQVQPT